MPGALLTPQEQSILAERVRGHEPSAEEELVRLFADRVSVLALARTRDRELARDLTQDVMLAVVLALRNGHLREAERLAAFVYGTARNVINNYLRTRSRVPRIDPLDVELEAAATRPDPVENSERAGLVRRALATPRFDRSPNPAVDAHGRAEARRDCRPPRPDVRSRSNPEVACPQKDCRTNEKAVTNMSANATTSTSPGMDCARVAREEIVERYLVDGLSDEDRSAFEEHYFECARCFEELEALQAIQAELRRPGAENEPSTRHSFLRWAPAAGLAAAIVLAVGVVVWMRPCSRPVYPNQPPPSNRRQARRPKRRRSLNSRGVQ